MKKTITLSVPTPCSEKWENFTLTPQGGFCSSCSKTVVDFTKMSDDEIASYFHLNAGKTCGRFRPDQLKVYNYQASELVRPGMNLFYAGLLAIVVMLLGTSSYAQTTPAKHPTEVNLTMGKAVVSDETKTAPGIIVKGVVRSLEDQAPLPGVNVVQKGTSNGVVTDADGKFEFPVELRDGDILVFSFIGLMTKEYRVEKSASWDVAMQMEIQMELCYELMGEVMADEVYTEPRSGVGKFWQKIKNIF